VRETTVAEATEEVNEAAKIAQATPRPGLETIFGDVYAEVPAHLRRQGEFLFDLSRRRGEAEAGDGKFPL
jgi:TPP-dependent pyruvate/acetoin dehydrogenase alpha subunit